MPKRKSYVRIRLYDKEKEDWEKYANKNNFPSVSQFIRFAVNDYIEKGLKITTKTTKALNNNEISKTDLLDILKEERESKEIERQELFQKIEELLQERRKDLDITIKHNIKGKILEWVEKFNGKLGSEELSEIINLPEPETVDILNKMQEQDLLKLNKEMKYEVKYNANNN